MNSYSKLIAVALLLSFSVSIAVAEEFRQTQGKEGAAQVLARLHSALPSGPIELEARMTTRSRRGEQIAESEIELRYLRSNSVFSVELTLYDAFGGLIEKVAVGDIGSDQPAYSYRQGEDLHPAEMPPLTERIADSEFRWIDLTLSFLWWPGGRLAGFESLKGRDCYVVDIPAPADIESVAGVELWIDSEMYALLRARFYDRDRETRKRFDVKSFAKTGEMWMVKDIDMRSYPSRRRTTLRVRNVSGGEGNS